MIRRILWTALVLLLLLIVWGAWGFRPGNTIRAEFVPNLDEGDIVMHAFRILFPVIFY